MISSSHLPESGARKRSRKERERSNTTRKLHKTSNAPSMALLVPNNASKVGLLLTAREDGSIMGNSNLSIDSSDSITNKQSVDSILSDDNICNELLKEVKRSHYIRLLRKKFSDLCAEQNMNPPIYTWERWQARSKLFDLQQDASTKATLSTVKDDMIPVHFVIDTGFVDDMVRGGFNQARAVEINTLLAHLSNQCAIDLHMYTASLSTSATAPDKKHEIKVVFHKHSIDFSIALFPKKLYKLTHQHYAKLQALYSAFYDARAISVVGKSKVKPTPDLTTDMHIRMFIMLSKYNSLLGHGFQMALGEHSFQVLRERFGTEFECFASPLNCTCRHFTSAFPSSDVFFGSVGNFFEYNPTEGSFEANPPFIPEVMASMVTKLHQLLSAATGPMSFVVIVPGWLDDPAWISLTSSPFKRACYLIAAKDHGYCDGAQHQRQDRYRESTYDTGLFILQNASGAAKWPIEGRTIVSSNKSAYTTLSVEAELRAAMSRAIPTDMMKLRRLRDGRGHGDLDGGGGVYKGKKSNATSVSLALGPATASQTVRISTAVAAPKLSTNINSRKDKRKVINH